MLWDTVSGPCDRPGSNGYGRVAFGVCPVLDDGANHFEGNGRMALSFKREAKPDVPEAVVFSDDFVEIDALAEDLDSEIGPDQWVEVANSEADEVFEDANRDQTFVILTLSVDTPEAVENTAQLIRKANNADMYVLLVCGDVSSRSMHMLIRAGAAEFAPYPEPAGALKEAINNVRVARAQGRRSASGTGSSVKRNGRLIGVYGVAGGVGASTMAVNIAWELSNAVRQEGRRVALLDFNFQYGSLATYLDVPRREAVYELVSEAGNMDQTAFTQALSTYRDRLHVLTAPRDALPLDIVSPSDVANMLKLARESFDYVVIDMPQALMNWSETVYSAADAFVTIMEIDMRSAQNMFRFLRTLKSEDLDMGKSVHLLNRAPGLTDLSGKTRVKRLAESLAIEFSHMMPDGGKAVVAACDQGAPLADAARSNPLRKEIVKLTQRLLEMTSEEAAEAAAG
ncbi:MAG: AAA family ATPase [Pseudomonadota bacterium]